MMDDKPLAGGEEIADKTLAGAEASCDKVYRSKYTLEDIPKELIDHANDPTKLNSNTKSFTASKMRSLPDLRVCVNMVKQSYWVYGYEKSAEHSSIRRNFTWSTEITPEDAWVDLQWFWD